MYLVQVRLHRDLAESRTVISGSSLLDSVFQPSWTASAASLRQLWTPKVMGMTEGAVTISKWRLWAVI
jgi:hypothetical protein